MCAEEGRWQAITQIVTSLRDDTNRLQQQVIALRETNQLEGLRIAMLNSLLKDSPKAIAVSLWDNESQKGVIVVQNLKPSPANWDYQLWIMDPKYSSPVNAGVFQVVEQGNVRVQFTARKPIASADKFAVTMEPKGGLDKPTLKNLVLGWGVSSAIIAGRCLVRFPRRNNSVHPWLAIACAAKLLLKNLSLDASNRV